MKNMGMDPSIWIAVGALLVSIIFGILNTSHNSNSDIQAQLDDARKQAAQDSKIETKLSAIQDDTQDIKTELRGMKADINDMNKRLTIVEQSTKSAWHKIDELSATVGITGRGEN